MDKATHKEVNKKQRAFNARTQTGIENINANAKILKDHPDIPNSAIDELEKRAKKHNDEL